MKAQKVEHFLQWRKATNQAGTHKVNRLANSDRPILDKTKYNRGDIESPEPGKHVGYGVVLTEESVREALKFSAPIT